MIRLNSVTAKLLGVAGTAIGALLIAASVVVMQETNKSIARLADDYGVAVADSAASNISSELSAITAIAKTFATDIASYHNSGGRDRSIVLKTIRPRLEDSPLILGSWFFAAPDAWDGQDAANLGKKDEGANSLGRLTPYYARPNGQVVLEPLEDADAYGGEYYTAPAKSMKAAITEPYSYTVGGKAILMTSIGYPVVSGGKLIGVAGLDIALSDLTAELANTKPFGEGRLTLLSHAGKWVAHPNPELLVKDFDGPGKDAVTKVLSGGTSQQVAGVSEGGVAMERWVIPVDLKGLDNR